jgi:hypothetical protein
MKLNFKEDPREWRKQALLTLLGLALISGLLRWRRVLAPEVWYVGLAVLAAVAACALIWPRWFRGYYRFSLRAGFWLGLKLGRFLLRVVFLVLVTPLGWGLRLMGKDPLQLRRPDPSASGWHRAREWGPLDRLF